MSILDQIYGSAKTVQQELKGMNAALKTMAAADKKEYSLDAKDRKYEREKDKREAQDRKDFNKKVFTTLDDQSKDLGQKEQGKKLAAGLASATASAIAETVKKNKDKKNKQTPEPTGTGGPAGISMTRREEAATPSRIQPKDNYEERIAELEKTVFSFPQEKAKKFQSGGFTGAVPNLGQPTTGDHFYTHVQPGSYVLNRNAVQAMGFQGGGNVPVALEQGEIVIPPGKYDQKMMDVLNYAVAPRFQEGGKTGKKEGSKAPEVPEIDESAKGKFGLVNPTPRTKIADNKLGYAADTGLDIQGNTGDPIVAPAAGILEYLEKGHTSWTDDSDPGTAGYQPQHSFRIKLDAPFEYAGKKVNFAYGTHMSAISKELGNTKDKHVSAGTYLGNLGVANSVPHLHLGLVTDRPQTSFLNYKEVSAVLQGAPTTGSEGGDSENNTGSGDGQRGTPAGGDSQTIPQQEGSKGVGGFSGPFAGLLSAIDKQVFQSAENKKYGVSLSMLLGGADAFSDIQEIGSGGGGGDQRSGADQPTGGGGGGGDDSSGDTPSGGGESVSVQSGRWGPVLDLIAQYEAGPYKWEGMFPSTRLAGATKMTIAEVASKATGAVGMYQNLPRYLNERARAVGLNPMKDLYNKENQIKIAEYLIGPGQANITVDMAKSNPKKAMHQLSKVWAAIPKDDGGRSYYAGDGVNKAHIKPAQMYAAFKKLQSGGMVGLLSKVVGMDLSRFFENSDNQLQLEAMSEDPMVFDMGADEEAEPRVTFHESGKNLPDYDLPTRDYCPLSVYYRYHPSLNPQGMNP